MPTCKRGPHLPAGKSPGRLFLAGGSDEGPGSAGSGEREASCGRGVGCRRWRRWGREEEGAGCRWKRRRGWWRSAAGRGLRPCRPQFAARRPSAPCPPVRRSIGSWPASQRLDQPTFIDRANDSGPARKQPERDRTRRSTGGAGLRYLIVPHRRPCSGGTGTGKMAIPARRSTRACSPA